MDYCIIYMTYITFLLVANLSSYLVCMYDYHIQSYGIGFEILGINSLAEAESYIYL